MQQLTAERNVLNSIQYWSGKRDSNPRPSAWKADALPAELHPHFCGERRIRTSVGVRRQIYSLLPLTARPSPQQTFSFLKSVSHRRDSNPRPTDYKSVALPAELRWHAGYSYFFESSDSGNPDRREINKY